MWNLTTTVNYAKDEKEYSLDYSDKYDLLKAIEKTIQSEHTATSFVFVVCECGA